MIQVGLGIVCTRGGYWPWVRIAWCRPRAGNPLVFDLVNARVISRYGTNGELSVLAAKGPLATTKLLTASVSPEPQFAVVERFIPCDPAAWTKDMSMPEDWQD